MLASSNSAICTQEQHDDLLRHVRLGRLFELMDWIEAGHPTLCPEFEKPKPKQSAIRCALERGNHSMVQFLWERCWQRDWEIEGLISTAIYDRNAPACEIAKYLIRKDLPIGDPCASLVFETHDDELIMMMLERGMSVRGPDGFADALACTGHSKHLLRLYRELNGQYPDLVTEGLLALREAVEKQKVRAVALLTWAGVDPLKQIPSDPYEENDEPSDDPDDEPYVISALDQVRVNEKAPAIVKALKVEMTDEVWFDFLDEAGWLSIEQFPEVFHWIRNPEDTLTRNPDKTAKVATSIFKHLEGWSDSWRTEQGQRLKLQVCEYLAWIGTPMLVTERDYEIRQIRKAIAAVKDTKLAVRVLWLIHEKGDEAQRERLKEIIRTPKMQSLVRQYDPFLLRDLGLGPKRMADVKCSKSDRVWHMDIYKPPAPPERPVGERKNKRSEPLLPPSVYYPPSAPAPAPSRPGYWNRYSHFHR